MHGGRLRPCLVFVPPDTGAGVANELPLLLALHGGGGNPLSMARLTRFHEIAARERFIVAYPSGAGPGLRRRTWNAGGADVAGWAGANGIDDVGYLRGLINDLAREFSVDRRRVYAAGMSMGAMMAYRFALEASDVVAAIAAVAGPMCEDGAAPPQPVSIVHIHGARDENVPFEGGRGRLTRRGAHWPSSKASLEFWRRANHCGETKIETAAGRGLTRQRSYAADGSEVELVMLEKRGHEWPRPRPMLFRRLLGTAPNDGLNASEEIWRFFKEKRLSR